MSLKSLQEKHNRKKAHREKLAKKVTHIVITHEEPGVNDRFRVFDLSKMRVRG